MSERIGPSSQLASGQVHVSTTNLLILCVSSQAAPQRCCSALSAINDDVI